MGWRIRWIRRAAIVASCAAAVGTIGGLILVRRYQGETWPFTAWATADTIIWGTATASGLLLSGAALWLTIRLSRNPTGWWLSLSALAFAAWMAGRAWPAPSSPYCELLLPPVYKAAAAMAILAWPTGRLEPRWRRPVAATMGAYLAIGLVAPFIGTHITTLTVTRPQHLMWGTGGYEQGLLSTYVSQILLGGVAPALLLPAVVRRFAIVTPMLRPTVAPAFVGAVLLALVEILVTVADQVLSPFGALPSRQAVPIVSAVAGVGRFGLVAILVVVAEATRSKRSSHIVDLGAASDASSVDVKRLLHDPTARLILGDDNSAHPHRGRAVIGLADQRGVRLGSIEHDAAAEVDTAHLDLLVAAIELEVLRQARRTAAEAATQEIIAMQRDVLDTQDRARRQLERDLHDGVQQQLVALTLQASRATRTEQRDGLQVGDRLALADGIAEAARLTRTIVVGGTPAAVQHGLSAGLLALRATIPIRSALTVDGDIPVTHRAAPVLWFVAAEAVANALKHAAATEIDVRLQVQDRRARLTIRDNGVGGVTDPTQAIASRVATLPAVVSIASPHGHGTTVQVDVDLATTASSLR